MGQIKNIKLHIVTDIKKSPYRGEPTSMSEAVDDRFARVAQDPRFKKIPREERRVKIDARFEKMFTDKSFHTKFTKDKRGKRLEDNKVEDLNKFYELENSEDDDEEVGDGEEEDDEFDDGEDEVDIGEEDEKDEIDKQKEKSSSPNFAENDGQATTPGSKLKKKRKGKLLANVSGRNTILSSAKKNKKKKNTAADSNKDVSATDDPKPSSATSKPKINFKD